RDTRTTTDWTPVICTHADYVGSQGGLIQVAGAANGTGTGATLELQTTTINGGGAITNPAVFNIQGKLEADSGANTIENFTAGNFTNDGELLVTGNSTTLTLLDDTLTDYVATQGAIIVVARAANATATGTIVELQAS